MGLRQRAICVALLSVLTSVSALGDSRWIGITDSRGMGVLVDTSMKVPSAKFVLQAGHLPNPNWKLPARTTSRFGVSSDVKLDGILEEADQRFAKKLSELRSNREIVLRAKEIAPLYNVDPAAVVASILTELTFNNSYEMGPQNLAVSLIPSQSFYSGANELIKLLDTTPLKTCKPERSDYWSWFCMNNMWNTDVWMARNPKEAHLWLGYIAMSPAEDGLGAKISPKFLTASMGSSFGPAQITLLRALMASEDVTRVSGGKFPRVYVTDMPAVQKMIADVEPSVHIVAATIARSIYAYRKYARCDISPNIGIQTTLFNLGREVDLAYQLNRANLFAKVPTLPAENYFGWFTNRHEAEIRQLVKDVQ